MYPFSIITSATSLISLSKKLNIQIATAESCTGGLIAGALTEIPGSSAVYKCGYNTYSNDSKSQLLSVSTNDLKKFGAVSETVAIQMAHGALTLSNVQLAVAVTGVAGPDGGTSEKPVGTVHIAASYLKHATTHERFKFSGDRTKIRMDTVLAALKMMEALIVN